MKIKHGKNIKIFTCDVRNLPNNFVDLASRSYNNYGVFYITGIYSRNEVNTLPLFLSNISKFELDNFIEPVIMTSEEASKVVPNELDFLFIDGSHTFESARSDYKHWVKKLRLGFKLVERRKSLVILKR